MGWSRDHYVPPARVCRGGDQWRWTAGHRGPRRDIMAEAGQRVTRAGQEVLIVEAGKAAEVTAASIGHEAVG